MPKHAKHQTMISPDTGEILVDEQTKARQWTFLIYPGDSAPDDWQIIIDQKLVPYCIGPLHQGEVSEKTGEVEKDHRHVELLFNCTKSYNQIYRFVKGELHGSVPMPIQDLNLQTRYFLHLDHPQKTQYERTEMIYGNLFDLDACLAPPKQYRNKLMMAMIKYIQESGVTELIDFMDFCMEREPAWFDLLVNSKTNLFDKAIRSNRGKIELRKKKEDAENQILRKLAQLQEENDRLRDLIEELKHQAWKKEEIHCKGSAKVSASDIEEKIYQIAEKEGRN